ncbi:MAG: ISAs1 family transposase [gamma proteobacterium symbiont of Bathyaustriella thionipta]|nr:ISAs1 family transposase [gamma proteobacterium symbiont of Bathyaustriella thionipta]MCU7951533.1 ISAs1 family transposase [gamma proteobacterium symbiont of Bathyaustriella thionipta]
MSQLGLHPFETTDQGHGRIEIRRCTQVELDISWLTNGEQWKGLKTGIEIESERHVDEQISTEKRYYISSHKLNAEQALSIVRSHWEVENKLHWVLDVTFREDESRIRRGNGAEVMNALRKITLNLLKQNTTKQASLKRKRKLAALDDNFRAEILLGQHL